MSENKEGLNGYFTSSIVVITSLSMLFGVISNVVFYLFFNFNVFDFLQINEIITHTIKDSLFFAVPCLVLMYIFIHTNKPQNKSLNTNADLPKKNKTFKIVLKGMVISIFLAWILLTFIFNKISLPTMYAGLFAIVLYLFSPGGGFIMKFENAFNIQFTLKGLSIFYTIIMVAFFSVLIGLRKANSIKYEHSTKDDYILIKNIEQKPCDTIKSNTQYYYIGKTDNYVFFYDSEKDNVDVYPDKDILKYSLN